MEDPTTLVAAFNALPRNKTTPSGIIPNHWHITVRHIPITPTYDVLFLVNPAGRFTAVEGPLPDELKDQGTALKATTVALLLLKAFVGALGGRVKGREVRPWTWCCNDAELAGALGEVLRGMGVTAPEGVVSLPFFRLGPPSFPTNGLRDDAMCAHSADGSLMQGVAEEEDNKIAEDEWNKFYVRLAQSMQADMAKIMEEEFAKSMDKKEEDNS